MATNRYGVEIVIGDMYEIEKVHGIQIGLERKLCVLEELGTTLATVKLLTGRKYTVYIDSLRTAKRGISNIKIKE